MTVCILDGNNFSESDRTLANHNLDGGAFTDSDRTLSTQTDEGGVDGGVDGGVVSEPDRDIYSNLNVSTKDADETGFDMFSNTNGDTDSDFDYQADNSNVTDDEYDTGLEDARAIVWRQVAFHIIGSTVHGRPRLDKSHAHYGCNPRLSRDAYHRSQCACSAIPSPLRV